MGKDSTNSPFLQAFHNEQRGLVLYPADPPFRARDSKALDEVTPYLPSSLSAVERRLVLAPQQVTFHQQDILNYIKQHLVKLGELSEDSVGQFAEDMVGHLRDGARYDLPCPDVGERGPLLILGKPEAIMPSLKSDLKKKAPAFRLDGVLDRVGYPGRFRFLSNEAEDDDSRTICDHRTGKKYRTNFDYQRFMRFMGLSKDSVSDEVESPADCAPLESYAVIFHGILEEPVRRPVTIVAGSCSLATWGSAMTLADPDMFPQLMKQAGKSLTADDVRRYRDFLFPSAVGDLPMTSDTCRFEALVKVTLSHRRSTDCHLTLRPSDISIEAAGYETRDYRLFKYDVPAMLRAFNGVIPENEEDAVNVSMREDFNSMYAASSSGVGSTVTVSACEYPKPDQRFGNKSAFLVGGGHIRKVVEDAETASKKEGVLGNTMVLGPSGTGKELVAKILYSYRRQRLLNERTRKQDILWRPANCGAFSSSLVEAQLFGAEKGSFTVEKGASSEKKGIFLGAKKGIACLDEIGESPNEVQTDLLRVLEDRTVSRVGKEGEDAEKVECQIVAMTLRDLEAASVSDEGPSFRKDLLARFHQFIKIKPLIERRWEVPAIVLSHFANAHGITGVRVRESALRALLAYEYDKSNVRELRSILSKAEESCSFRDDKVTLATKNLKYACEQLRKRELLVILDSEEEIEKEQRNRKRKGELWFEFTWGEEERTATSEHEDLGGVNTTENKAHLVAMLKEITEKAKELSDSHDEQECRSFIDFISGDRFRNLIAELCSPCDSTRQLLQQTTPLSSLYNPGNKEKWYSLRNGSIALGIHELPEGTESDHISYSVVGTMFGCNDNNIRTWTKKYREYLQQQRTS